MPAVFARTILLATLSVAAVATVASGARLVVNSGESNPVSTSASLPLSPAVTGTPADRPRITGLQRADIVRSFYFARAAYPSGGGGFRGGGGAYTDWPDADRVIITVLARLTNVDVHQEPFAIELTDPDLARFPFLYFVEVGRMNLREREVLALRKYLLSGGFMVVDDFWGRDEWENFEYYIRQVLPEHEIVPITIEHPIFHTVYDVDELHQVPNIGNARDGFQTTECYGCEAELYGIFDDNDRMMVVINFNTDLGDAWEWAEDPDYPIRYSTYAYQMGANFIVYAMTR